jgi:hypothetical protein
VLTWSRTALLLDLGVDEMADQVDLAKRLVDRFARTGRVAFDGPDYQLAKTGLIVMDMLASTVDAPTAVEASEWGEATMNEWHAACAKRVQADAQTAEKAAA